MPLLSSGSLLGCCGFLPKLFANQSQFEGPWQWTWPETAFWKNSVLCLFTTAWPILLLFCIRLLQSFHLAVRISKLANVHESVPGLWNRQCTFNPRLWGTCTDDSSIEAVQFGSSVSLVRWGFWWGYYTLHAYSFSAYIVYIQPLCFHCARSVAHTFIYVRDKQVMHYYFRFNRCWLLAFICLLLLVQCFVIRYITVLVSINSNSCEF